MLLAYIDESGNTGDPAKGGTATFTLGCVVVDSSDWPATFESLLMNRRQLRSRYGIRIRSEVKANFLIRSNGDLARYGLSPTQRKLLYRSHLRIAHAAKLRAFAVVVDKRAGYTNASECFDLAWETLLQRLERTSNKEHKQFMVLHDEGENDAVRRWVRKARRYLTAGSAFGGGGVLVNPARLLIDDPSPKRSEQSLLIQMADLVAYAGFRAVVEPSERIASVCPSTMWTELGGAIHRPVAALRPRSEPGIVLRALQ